MTLTPLPTLTATPLPTATPTLIPTLTRTPTPTVTPTPTPVCVTTVPPRATTAMELYGTIHAMGVIVSIDANDDPDQNAMAFVEYRTGSKPFRAGFPLSRVSNNRFVGSLFWLEPGTTYDVRVTFVDKGGSLNCVALTGSAQTRPEVTVPEPIHSYYVSPNGSGSACSIDAPCSLMEGINRANPGDAVVLRGGVYYQGEIKLPRSGKAGAPIMLQGYPGETAILDGADPVPLTWISVGNGLYRAVLNIPDTNLVLANGQRLYHYSTLEDLQNLRWQLPGFYTENGTIYVRLANDVDPNKVVMIVGNRSYAFWVEQQYIYFLNLTFRHYGQGMYRTALYLRNASDGLVHGNKFITNDLAIALKGASHRNVIENNEFSDTIHHWGWDAVKALKSEYSLEKGGIRFWEPNPGDPQVTSRGTIIRHNSFHDYFDGFAACHWGTIAQPTNETDVYENTIYNVGDDGMEIDGPASNIRIWGNTIKGALAGISMAPARIGPVYAIRNQISHLGRTSGCPFGQPPPCGGTSFKFQYDIPGSGPMFLFHNTVDAALVGRGIYIVKPATWPKLYARNNIWLGAARFAIEYDADDPIDFDYDNLGVTQLTSIVQWKGTKYTRLSDFVRATGQEQHGLNVDPRFVDPAKGNYRLIPDSRLIDAGVHIPGINDDFCGGAPDIGAFEYCTNR
jgi:parallel beta-helix repeat protein